MKEIEIFTDENKMIRKNLFIVLLKIVCFLNNYTSCAEYGPSASLHVISRFGELPNFYEKLRVRSQNSQHVIPEPTDSEKMLFCKRIFGFDKVIYPEEYEKALKRDHETIFRELFKEEEETRWATILPRVRILGTGRKYNYDNSSKFRTFLVNRNERKENTFVCLIQNANNQTNQFDMYFVSSDAYNVNDAPNGEEVQGRFIFFGDEIYGLAEQIPLFRQGMRSLGSIERRAYIERRNRYKIAEKWEDDPVCKLDSGRKIRLCSYVCALFESGCENDKVKVEEPCVRRTYQWDGQFYENWMLTCKIEVATAENKLYVARNYRNNEAHVFGMGVKDNLRLMFSLSKVPVVLHEEELIAKL